VTLNFEVEAETLRPMSECLEPKARGLRSKPRSGPNFRQNSGLEASLASKLYRLWFLDA